MQTTRNTATVLKTKSQVPPINAGFGLRIIFKALRQTVIITAYLIYRLSIWWAWIQNQHQTEGPWKPCFRNTTVAHWSLKNTWTLIHHHILIEITQHDTKMGAEPLFSYRLNWIFNVCFNILKLMFCVDVAAINKCIRTKPCQCACSVCIKQKLTIKRVTCI